MPPRNEHLIPDLLARHGPALSSGLIANMTGSGVTETAARKRLQRAAASGSIRTLGRLRFPHNQRFCYLKDQYGSTDFLSRLVDAMSRSGSAYGVALNAMLGKGGQIPANHFDVLSGSPRKAKRRLTSKRLLKDLIDLGILVELPVAESESWVQLNERLDLSIAPIASVRAQLLAEHVLIAGIADWLRKTGFASYGKVRTRTESRGSDFGNFDWDLAGPSYIQPLVSVSKGKPTPGFVAADVNLSLPLDLRHVEYFIKKCASLKSQPKIRPFIPILVGRGFRKDAFTEGRKRGLLFVTPESLLGKHVSQAISLLIETLTKAAASVAKNPEIIDQLFHSLATIEGAAINVRGALFELVVGHCVLKREGNSIDIRVRATDPSRGQSAEVDVLRVRGDEEVACYECRGIAPNSAIDEESIKTWCETKVPIVRNWLLSQERFRDRGMSFEFWTTGTFSNAATSYLESRRKNTKKYRIDFKSGCEVLEYARSGRITSMTRVLNEHFLRQPTAAPAPEQFP